MIADTEILLSVESLNVHFHGEEETARAVDGVDFEVRRRENVCLVGESGCGKTVSALAVLGLISRPPGRVTGKHIFFDGEELLAYGDAQMEAIRGKRIGMVFQEPLTSLNPVLTIGEQIAEPLQVHTDRSEADIRDTCVQLLQDVGIDRPAARLADYPHQMSGGQRQRVMIAMALACGPDLLIADEPTTALDVTIQAQILKLLAGLQRARGMAVLYITHDLGVVSQIADRVYVMYAGLIVEHGHARSILREPRHPYTRALLASLPHRKKRGQRLHSIAGSVPHPAHKPPGCPFHPRCGRAVAACRTEPPGLCRFSDSHAARCPVAAGIWR
ncbi:MAG: ABC transporter ATP-binding protein [Desulfobacterales bacterium]